VSLAESLSPAFHSRWRRGVRSAWPGVLLCAVVAIASAFISDHRGGPTLLYALLLGMALNSVAAQGTAKPGIDFTARQVLRFGVALLGARITVDQIGGLGWYNGGVVVLGVLVTIGFGWALARALGLSRRIGILTGGAIDGDVIVCPRHGARFCIRTGEVLSPEACRTGASIFDGRLRYDLKLDFKRMESVKAERGYHGAAVVCAVYFTPVAGYIPDRPVIKWLATQRNMEIAFVPVAGTRILVPFRMSIPTPLGPALLEATSFVTTAAPPRIAKTQ